MKDVEFPLDLVFTDDSGRVTEKMAMPVDRDGTLLYRSGDPSATHAIELPLGFCERHSIEAGDTVVPASLTEED